MKVIFLSYANSVERPLDTLNREDDGVQRSLIESNRGLYYIHREPYATLERLNEALGIYTGSLCIFHFSGHAGKDSLLLSDTIANATGIAYQLGESAKRGTLKLVVLNGCSTAGQVRRLLDIGVPAVVATNSSVEDKSATEFSIRFYRNICQRKMTIRQAFDDALGPAQTVTNIDLKIFDKPTRRIGFLNQQDDLVPLWELFCKSPEDVDINPLPALSVQAAADAFEPNEQLTQIIFEALARAGNKKVQDLQHEEASGTGEVTLNDKQKAIIKYLPFPVSAHLQKLFTSIEGSDGFDKTGLRRLEQIGRAYHMVMEFLGFIMIAQLWESKLREDINILPGSFKKLIGDYFYLTTRQRATFNYLPFIKQVWAFLDSMNQGTGTEYFVEELKTFNGLATEDTDFADACDYLNFIRTQTIGKLIDEQKATEICIEAEIVLGKVFGKLGFLHRYTLTSIQKIHILKYRHNLQAHFNHQIIRLMDAFGAPERTHYILSTFLDNSGVVLTKQALKTFNFKKNEYEGEKLDFLNLSPFVIDRNAFESRTDRSNLMFFEQFKESGTICFKNVRRPESEDDGLEVLHEEQYDALSPQFEAFRSMIRIDMTETDKL